MRTLSLSVTAVFAAVFLLASTVFAQDTEFGTGMLLDDAAYNETPLLTPLMRGPAEALPPGASLKKFAPFAGNQGKSSTCVGWATAYSARTIVLATENGWTDRGYITDQAQSPSYVYNTLKNMYGSDPACSKGAYVGHALEIMKIQGSLSLEDFPFSCGRPVTPTDDSLAVDNRILEYSRLIHSTSSDKVGPIKRSIAEGKPVVIGMYVPTSFMNSIGRDVWEAKEPLEEVTPYDGHAMTIVGYDDTKYGGAFEVMNSWGTRWGNEGFIWIPYEDLAAYLKYAFDVYVPTPVEETEQNTLEVQFRLVTGQDMPFELEDGHHISTETYTSDTEFEISVGISSPLYVYAIATDLSRNTTLLFPDGPQTSAYLGYEDAVVDLHGDDVFYFDFRPGRDFVTFLASAAELPIEDILENVNKGGGSFAERIEGILANVGMSRVEETLETASELAFDPLSAGQYVLMSYELKHADQGSEADADRPRLSLLDPSTGQSLEETVVTMTLTSTMAQLVGYASDDGSISAMLLNGEPITVSSIGEFSVPLPSTTDPYSFELTVVDNAGNQTTSVVTVEYELPDETPPSIAVDAPNVIKGKMRGLGRRKRAITIDVLGSFQDESEVTGIFIDGQEADLLPDNRFSLSTRIPANQPHFELRAIDIHGNEVVESYYVVDEGEDADSLRDGSTFVEEDPGYVSVEVFYGTNRDVTFDSETGYDYSGRRGELSVGTVLVSIPDGHQVGELESPSWFRFDFKEDPNEHVTVLERTPMNKSDFQALIKRDKSRTSSNEGFVFIHGYNTSFDDAARRTGQIAFDLGFDGVPMFFSWPSDGTLISYSRDEADTRWSVPDLVDYLTTYVVDAGFDKVHLIAHSMGSRLLSETMLRMSLMGHEDLFGQVVLAAPDVDAAVFSEEIAPAMTRLSDRVTVYASSADRALQASRELHGYPRAGESGSFILALEGVDTIDASGVDMSMLGHNYFATVEHLLRDLYALLTTGAEPMARSLERMVKDPWYYWLFPE